MFVISLLPFPCSYRHGCRNCNSAEYCGRSNGAVAQDGRSNGAVAQEKKGQEPKCPNESVEASQRQCN